MPQTKIPVGRYRTKRNDRRLESDFLCRRTIQQHHSTSVTTASPTEHQLSQFAQHNVPRFSRTPVQEQPSGGRPAYRAPHRFRDTPADENGQDERRSLGRVFALRVEGETKRNHHRHNRQGPVSIEREV